VPDPDQFESLFSRVMSLVPPKELETVLSDVTDTVGLDDPTIQRIGRLVTEGFRSWSAFDDAYRKQAEQIRATEPGEAHWADLGHFLVKHCGADDGEAATFGTFTFLVNEIVAVEEEVPTIRFAGRTFACGDTGGLRAVAADGSAVHQLGLNLDAVQAALGQSFTPSRKAGLAFLNRPAGLAFLGHETEGVVVLVFLRQQLVQERGVWAERGLSMHCYALGPGGAPAELTGPQRAAVIRACQNVPRIKDGAAVSLRVDLPAVEEGLFRNLKRPTEEQMAAGVRYAVWPLVSLVLVP
jgi:hypothetical protein